MTLSMFWWRGLNKQTLSECLPCGSHKCDLLVGEQVLETGSLLETPYLAFTS